MTVRWALSSHSTLTAHYNGQVVRKDESLPNVVGTPLPAMAVAHRMGMQLKNGPSPCQKTLPMSRTCPQRPPSQGKEMGQARPSPSQSQSLRRYRLRRSAGQRARPAEGGCRAPAMENGRPARTGPTPLLFSKNQAACVYQASFPFAMAVCWPRLSISFAAVRLSWLMIWQRRP
jgi:hypothetical protein